MKQNELDPTMQDFLQHLELKGRYDTAHGYRTSLTQYHDWLSSNNASALSATTDTIRAFQRFLADEYRMPDGSRLEKSTQATRLAGVKSYYGWLARRGLILVDPSRKVRMPSIRKGLVHKDHFTLQEVTALLQTQWDRSRQYRLGSFRWAKEYRDLALLVLGFATGRRRKGLRGLKVHDINLERAEVRCEWEKGKAGRVLPLAKWATGILQTYVEKARPVLNWWHDNDWLIVGESSRQIGNETFNSMLSRVHRETVERNPDLAELAHKHITAHSLRVSFATLLFSGGCSIRAINELMMHEQLATTARYTPIPLEELRRSCRAAHPRA